MIKRVTCPQCGVVCECDIKPVWEENREREEYSCPDCSCFLLSAFTDQIPYVRVIKHGNCKLNLKGE